MARGEKFVTLYDPATSTAVEVPEARGKMLMEDRGYTDKKPRDFGKSAAAKRGARSAGGAIDNSAELAEKDAEIERLRAELEAAQKPAEEPKK